MGMKPGPEFKAILNEAYELQIDGMNDVNEILEKLKLSWYSNIENLTQSNQDWVFLIQSRSFE